MSKNGSKSFSAGKKQIAKKRLSKLAAMVT